MGPGLSGGALGWRFPQLGTGLLADGVPIFWRERGFFAFEALAQEGFEVFRAAGCSPPTVSWTNGVGKGVGYPKGT